MSADDNFCRRTKKQRYPTGALAHSSLLALQSKGHGEIRFYRCSSCNGFHLTSQPKAA